MNVTLLLLFSLISQRRIYKTVGRRKHGIEKHVEKLEDTFQEAHEPDAVVFLARSDVLSGLLTPANLNKLKLKGVFSPFSAG